MTTTLTDLKVATRLTGRLVSARKLDDSLSTPGATTELNSNISLDFGQGAGAADQMFQSRRVLAASAADDLDLAAGLEDEYGQEITFAKIKGVIVHNRSDDQGTPTDAEITVGGHATAAWYGMFGAADDKMTLPAGYTMAWYGDDANGKAVVATSADMLTITNLDGSDQAEYDVIIFGESA